MGRPKDKQYWDQVTEEKDGKLKCKHRDHKFKGGVSRIKAHVDRIHGQGVTVCSGNRDIGAHNSFASGSNGPQEAPNGMNIPVEGSAPVHTVTGSNNSALGSDDEINELNELLDDLTREESDIKGQLE